MSILAQLLIQSEEISSHAIADSSRKTYEMSLRIYEKVMSKIGEDPYPISIEKMMGFLTYQYNQGRKCTTLMNYVGGLSNYFRSNDLDNLTQSIRFKIFKSGLRKKLKVGLFPCQKEPFDQNWFLLIYQHFPVNMADNAKFMLLITLCWQCFLRVSEAQNLRKSDLFYDGNKLMVTIRWSKTDQLGNSEICYVYPSNSYSNPINYLNVLQLLDDEDSITGLSIQSLRSHLKFVLQTIGVSNPEEYSFHSFRRGAALLASERGVQDCVIKKHGRWKSDAYMRYVRVEAARAGNEISYALH